MQEEKLAVLAEPVDCEKNFYHHHVNHHPHDHVAIKPLATNHLKSKVFNCLGSNPPTTVDKITMVVDLYCHYHQNEVVVN